MHQEDRRLWRGLLFALPFSLAFWAAVYLVWSHAHG